MTGLPIKYRDGAWQVRVPEGANAVWVDCDSEADAYDLAQSSDLADDVLEGVEGVEIAHQLEQRALLSLKYGRASWADHLRELAKLALHQPSAFDGQILD